MNIRKLILAGGTGFLGNSIIDAFKDSIYEIIVFTRGSAKERGNVKYLHWDGTTLGDWSSTLEDADVLINLSGKSVDCRYNEQNKSEIYSSRLNATRILGMAINKCKNPPKVWINAASATIYRHAEDRPMDEFDGEIGKGFSVDVCKKWEAAFDEAKVPGTRKLALRISMVFGKNGGVLPVLKKIVGLGLGGKMGNGKQYVSWVHEGDFVRALQWLIENERAEGIYNIAAPEPLRNDEFMRLMRKQLDVKFGLPASSWMLEIGAFFLRTETELILKSRRVISMRLQKEGFVFNYSSMEEALKDLLK